MPGILIAFAIAAGWYSLATSRVVYAVGAAIALTVAAVAWRVSFKQTFQDNRTPIQISRIRMLLAMTFLAALSSGLLGLRERLVDPDNVALFLGSIYILAFLVAYETFGLPLVPRTAARILCQVVSIGILIETAAYLQYPSVIGVDPWWHQMFTNAIVRSSHIPAGLGYSSLPNTQVLTAISSEAFGADYKAAAFYSIGFAQIALDPLLIYLLVARGGQLRSALAAAEMVMAATFALSFGLVLVPTTLATTLLLLVFLLLLQPVSGHRTRTLVLVLLSMVAVILTHAPTSLILLVLLVVIWFAGRLGRSRAIGGATPVSLSVATLFGVEMLGWWGYASGNLTDLARAIRWGFNLDLLTGLSPGQYSSFIGRVPLTEQLLAAMGLILFVSVAIGGGILAWRSRDSKMHRGIVETLSLAGLPCLIIGGIAIALQLFFLWDRWFYAGELLLAAPAGFWMVALARSKGSKATALVSALFATMVVLAMVSPQALGGFESLAPTLSPRYALSASELSAAVFVDTYTSGRVFSDAYFGEVTLAGLLQGRFMSAESHLVSGDYVNLSESWLVARSYWCGHAVPGIPGTYTVPCDVPAVLGSSGWSTIYSSGSVQVMTNLG